MYVYNIYILYIIYMRRLCGNHFGRITNSKFNTELQIQ